jgi:hypothetical protein
VAELAPKYENGRASASKYAELKQVVERKTINRKGTEHKEKRKGADFREAAATHQRSFSCVRNKEKRGPAPPAPGPHGKIVMQAAEVAKAPPGHHCSGDDDAKPRLPAFVRFHDLRAAGIVSNWPQLYNLIDDYGFPAGMLLSPNCRVWDVQHVRVWLDARPTERKIVNPPRGLRTGGHRGA